MPRRAGRKPLLTDEVQRRLLDAVRTGVPLEYSAAYAGVHPSTVRRWAARGDDEEHRVATGERPDPAEQQFRVFCQELTRARSEGMLQAVALIRKSAQGGYTLKETTRRTRDPDTGEPVTETDRHYAPVDWRAADRLVQMMIRPDLAHAQRLELSGPGGGPVQMEQQSTIPQLAARLHTIAAERQAELEAGGEPGSDAET